MKKRSALHDLIVPSGTTFSIHGVPVFTGKAIVVRGNKNNFEVQSFKEKGVVRYRIIGARRCREAAGSRGQNVEAVKRVGATQGSPLSNERKGHTPPRGVSATNERREGARAPSPVMAADLSRAGIKPRRPTTD